MPFETRRCIATVRMIIGSNEIDVAIFTHELDHLLQSACKIKIVVFGEIYVFRIVLSRQQIDLTREGAQITDPIKRHNLKTPLLEQIPEKRFIFGRASVQ